MTVNGESYVLPKNPRQFARYGQTGRLRDTPNTCYWALELDEPVTVGGCEIDLWILNLQGPNTSHSDYYWQLSGMNPDGDLLIAWYLSEGIYTPDCTVEKTLPRLSYGECTGDDDATIEPLQIKTCISCCYACGGNTPGRWRVTIDSETFTLKPLSFASGGCTWVKTFPSRSFGSCSGYTGIMLTVESTGMLTNATIELIGGGTVVEWVIDFPNGCANRTFNLNTVNSCGVPVTITAEALDVELCGNPACLYCSACESQGANEGNAPCCWELEATGIANLECGCEDCDSYNGVPVDLIWKPGEPLCTWENSLCSSEAPYTDCNYYVPENYKIYRGYAKWELKIFVLAGRTYLQARLRALDDSRYLEWRKDIGGLTPDCLALSEPQVLAYYPTTAGPPLGGCDASSSTVTVTAKDSESLEECGERGPDCQQDPYNCSQCREGIAPDELIVTIPNDWTSHVECDVSRCQAAVGTFALTRGTGAVGSCVYAYDIPDVECVPNCTFARIVASFTWSNGSPLPAGCYLTVRVETNCPDEGPDDAPGIGNKIVWRIRYSDDECGIYDCSEIGTLFVPPGELAGENTGQCYWGGSNITVVPVYD
ncbi:MAG: hypothetical protein AB7O62_11420 [Pirellulales bacterium]